MVERAAELAVELVQHADVLRGGGAVAALVRRTLETIKKTPELANMALVKLSRLSVGPVTDAEWKLICQMGGLKKAP